MRIIDDGAGFSPQVINRIGDPFLRFRRQGQTTPVSTRRPGYEGMGLGLFIAKTLLERSGAEMSFANGSDPIGGTSEAGERSGAVVEARWKRAVIAEADQAGRMPLGENTPIETG